MRDGAAEQLCEYKKTVKQPEKATSGFGAPLDSVTSVLTAGPKGPIVLQDINFIETITRFDRERIPERVVHAKGAGAKGFFDVTHNITKYTKAAVFSNVGKRTNIAVRFSTVGGESGSADTVRDPRGFAVKFYSDDGIFDLVGNNTPIFFIRDPILFPVFIHTQKRNPVTNLKDMDMFWDFITLRPETTHQVMILFSDRGIPDGYRHMNGYGSHTFKLVNKDGVANYCKFHFKTDQKIRNLPVNRAAELASSDPDYSSRDLYNAIHRGEFPSWTLYIQIMTPKQAEKFQWNAFDITKIWPHKEFPLIPVGKMVLNENPRNYFAEVEQIAFSPNNMIPGIEPSPDKLLQGRLFSYSDTHRHRLGANFLQLPVNCPYRVRVSNYERDGPQTITNQAGSPNYYPNSFSGPAEVPEAKISPYAVSGEVARYPTGDDDNFSQAALFWKNVLTSDERERLVNNIVGSLQGAVEFIQERAVKNFTKVSAELGEKLTAGLKLSRKTKSHL